MLHVGTLAAVVIFYRRLLWLPVEKADVTTKTETAQQLPAASLRLAWYIILATLPAVAAALVFGPRSSVRVKVSKALTAVGEVKSATCANIPIAYRGPFWSSSR